MDGEEDKAQRVKSRSFAAAFKAGVPLARHVKLTGDRRRDAPRLRGRRATRRRPRSSIPSDHWVTRLEGQLAWDWRGWALTGRYAWNKRSQWDPWGYAGNPDYSPDKDAFTTWGVELQKDFHLPRFQRIRTSVGYVGSDNTDRFSKYQFGFFGGTSLRGFRSGALRAEEAVTSKVAYGYVIGSAFRLEVDLRGRAREGPRRGPRLGLLQRRGHLRRVRRAVGDAVRLDAGTPVSGRNRGFGGVVLSLNVLKIF